MFSIALSRSQSTIKHIQYTLAPYKLLLVIFAAVQCWILIQLVPLPQTWLFTISPSHQALATQVSEHAVSQISLDPSETWGNLLKGLSYLALIVLTLLLITTEKRLKLLLLVMISSGLAQATYGIVEVYSGWNTSLIFERHINHFATGSFIYKNHFANFMLLTSALAIGLLIASLSTKTNHSSSAKLKHLISTLVNGKATVRVALAIIIIGLVASRSRMGNAAFFISLTITGIYALIYFKHRSKGLSVLLISLFVIDTFIFGAWFGIDKVKEHIANTSLSQETRDEVLIEGLALIKDFPITGTGSGSFYTVFPQVQGEDVTSFYDHAHNDYLEFAIELGLPITLMLGALVLLSLWQSAFAMYTRHHSLMKGTAFGTMVAIIGMLIHITVDFNLQAPANAMYFILILTMAWQSRFLCRRTSKVMHSS
ncbi:O-antigen ligase family protein [Colwellia sp. MEBiC06753]